MVALGSSHSPRFQPDYQRPHLVLQEQQCLTWPGTFQVVDVPVFHPIKVTVVQVRGDQVRLGIEAPQDVSVLRAELEGSGAKTAIVAA